MARLRGSSSAPTTWGCMRKVHDRMADGRRQDGRIEQAAAVAVGDAASDEQEQAERP